jgi:Fe-S cluster biogenesis protein NfuA
LSRNELKPAVFETLMDFFASGRPIMDDGASLRKDTAIHEDDDEMVIMIKEVLDAHVRPSVAQDGGDVEYRGFSQGVVMLKLQGACDGCSSSSATLKNGILRTLQHFVPEVTHVVAVDDDDLTKLNLEEFKKKEESLAQKKD